MPRFTLLHHQGRRHRDCGTVQTPFQDRQIQRSQGPAQRYHRECQKTVQPLLIYSLSIRIKHPMDIPDMARTF